MENEVENFLKVSLDSNSGSGSGYGDGYGDDYGDGDGSGSGSGYGSGYGDGYGDGDGSGYGYGDGDGSGSGSGYGSGSGSGSGYGSGYGDGYGDGSGYGYGYGNGDGDGNGCGDGNKDAESINGQSIYMIDRLPTIIISIHNNIANGYIVKKDLTLKPCYIAKVGNYFAHGDTVKQALSDAQNKYLQHKPIEERLADFNAAFPDRDKKIPAKELYKWHNILTGSCEMGRQQFCKEHNIDLKKDKLTINEFIDITKDSYGGDIIKQL